MKYSYDVTNGRLIAPLEQPERAVGYMKFGATPEVAELPAPVTCCTWDGESCVVDAGLVALHKARLAERIDNRMHERVHVQVTTPQGTFRIRRDDVDRYMAIGFAALFARVTSGTFQVTLRDVDGLAVQVNQDQTLRLLAAIGERYATVMQQADTRKAELAVATAEELKQFDTDAGIG